MKEPDAILFAAGSILKKIRISLTRLWLFQNFFLKKIHVVYFKRDRGDGQECHYKSVVLYGSIKHKI